MKRACYSAVLLFVAVEGIAAAPTPAVLEAEARRIAVIAKVKDCVLAVFPPSGEGGGSGAVISPDGYALSNFHVVAPCGPAMKCGMADGKIYDAVLVGVDPTGDMALLKLFGRDDFPCAELGDSDQVRAGDWVFALGNPFLLATDLQPTVTCGIVSGTHRYQFPAGTLLEYADCLQIDASINPGNSGGPLFDAEGRLIGVNGRASFEKRGRVNVGAAYAISINQIKNFLGALHSGRIVDHAALGVRVAADAEGRVVVSDILETSDAYRRGLRYDDEIVSFAGRPISTPNGFKNALGILPIGWRVPLSFRRDGQRHDIQVRLSGIHSQQELVEKATAAPPTEPSPEPKPGEPPKKSPIKANKPPAAPPMPEIVKKHFQERYGYANYYFNALHQRRVWRAWSAAANLFSARGVWTLAGQSEQGRPFHIRLSDDGASLKTASLESAWTPGGPWTESLPPAGSGGLLPALYLWRRLAVEGLGRFGDVRYEGTAPLPGREALADVLVGSHHGFECRFYFDPVDGRLLAMEMFSAADSDPCELYFSEDHSAAGARWPKRIEVRFGDELYAVFHVKEARVE